MNEMSDEQRDDMLEVKRMSEQDAEDDYYLDWLGDNKQDLEMNFIEDNEDQFSEYCKNAFQNRSRGE